jgi:NADH-quinone oxidoreductase subunit F/NADP-reducing hydrogenase subunit HndC
MADGRWPIKRMADGRWPMADGPDSGSGQSPIANRQSPIRSIANRQSPIANGDPYASLRAWAQEEFDRQHRAGQPRILLGLGTCGLAAGGREVRSAVAQKLADAGIAAEVWPVGCIGACFAEPLMDLVWPGGGRISYRDVTPERALRLIDEALSGDHLHPEWALAVIGDAPVDGIPPWKELPFFQYQERRVLRNCGFIDPTDLGQYILRDGYQALAKALTEMTPEAVIEEVQRAGLRGRGGAGFPTGRKWQLCRQAAGEPKYLVCNFDEGDPGAFMNRSLVEGDPHSLLEGLILGAYAIGARHGYIYVRAEYPLAILRLRTAIQQAEASGLLGDHILGSDFCFDVTIKEGAGAFVCGEETALLASIEGRRGMPRPRPPFPAQKGLWGQPTTINNVDTLSNVANIIRQGAEWFAGVGSETSKGTKTFCLTGKVHHTGLIEVPMGTLLGVVIEKIGGGILKGRAFKAAQTGGPSGGCLATQHRNLPLDYESLTRAGSIMGSGGLVVLDEDTCMVDFARFFLSFTQQESCGKCTPCRLGTQRMLEILERIVAGEGQREDLDRLTELGETVQLGSLCGLGQTAPNPVLSTLRYFRAEYEAHIVDRHCPALACRALVSYWIDPDVCVGCGLCRRKCPVAGVLGEQKAVHTIDQLVCTHCGTCFEVCPKKVRAVRKVTGREREALLRGE